MSPREDLHEKLALYGEACRAYVRAPGFRTVVAMTKAFNAALDTALSGQQGGAVPAGDDRCPDCGGPLDENDECPGWSERTDPRLAEQPSPAGTGDADRVEGLRPGIEKALKIVEAERETVSVSSSAYQRLWSVRNALRAALDGASGQEGR